MIGIGAMRVRMVMGMVVGVGMIVVTASAAIAHGLVSLWARRDSGCRRDRVECFNGVRVVLGNFDGGQ